MSTNPDLPPPTTDLTVDPIPHTRDNLERHQARWAAIDKAAAQLHPHRPLPPADLARQRARIARHGESSAAWNTFVLSGLLAEQKLLAIHEGLIGLALTLECAVRLLEEAEDLYAFARRDDADTDPHVATADERWFGPDDIDVVKLPTWSPEMWLLSDH